jgi:beta-galactosidase
MLGYPFDMLPQLIGIEDSRDFGPTGEMVLESQKIVNAIDGSRPILHHACGSIGNVHSSNIYLDFVQPQEKKEWLLEYKNKRVKPFYAVELGMPYANTYYYGRKGFGEVLKTEPLHCEYAAMELGESAYKKAGDNILRKIAEAEVKRGDNSTPDKYNPRINIHSTGAYLESQASLLDFLKYWRACEAGGLHPWATKLWDPQSWGWKEAKYANLKTPGIKTRFEYLPQFGKANVLHDIFKKNFSPLLLFIGGKKETFTDSRKNYFAGDQIDKSVVIVNDKHSDITFPMKISLLGKKGNLIESKKLQAELSPGQTKIYDFSFIAPNCLKKEELRIEAISTDPENPVNDSVKLQVFPHALKDIALVHKRSVFLLDTKGDSAKLLKSTGINFLEYKGNVLGDNDLLIIGRFSLPSAKDYSENIKTSLLHGANLLVFEQKKNDLRKYLGLRSFKASSRKVFTGYGSSDILPEISDSDLINWAGKATALREFPDPGSNSYPEHIWKQGNTGIVSSVTIEKPHCGPFLAILHEGYNLNYTPLLLEFIGKGKALYCQLDLTSRTKKEPAAMLVLKNIFNYLDMPSEYVPLHVAYSGDASVEKILSWMGINFNKTDNAKPGELWILGGNIKSQPAKLRDNIHEFLKNGGDMIVLNASDLSGWADFLGTGIKEYSMTGYAFDQKSLGALTKGLTAAEWYWKDNISMPIPEKDFPIKKINAGKGSVVFCQINPFYFDDKQMNQRRWASRIKMFKILSQIFTAKKASYEFCSCDCLKGVPENNIDLAGQWKFRIDPDNQGEKLDWHQTAWADNIPAINAPGCWEKQNIIQSNPNFPNSSMPYDGYAWYQKNISISKDFKDQKIYIEIGAIDDCDWIYFNGKLIGRTGKETKGWYAARRFYQIPNEIIKFDAPNLISIKVFDDNREGGIVSGPVRIIAKKIKEDFPYLETLETPRHDPYLFQRW